MACEEGYFLFIHVNKGSSKISSDTIPISEAYILAYLRHYGFGGSILVDCMDQPLSAVHLEAVLREKRPLALGFSAYQENIERIRMWARFAKGILPDLKVILGGPQATFMPGEALCQMEEVDFICRGEGELVMLGLARCLAGGGGDAIGVPGLSLLIDKIPRETGPLMGRQDLDDYPSPYLEGVIDLNAKEQAILFTSRGCPFGCLFCYTPEASGRKIRFHSLDRVLDEIHYLRKRGIERFWFADPNFSFSRERLEMLLDAIATRAPGVSFWCQTRYDLVDKKLLELLKKAGAHTVAYGLESGDQDVLRAVNKRLNLDKLREVIAKSHEAGLNVELFTLFGLPGETFPKALKTLNFVKENQVAIQGNSISQQLHLFFGTPIERDPASYGIRPLPWTRPAYLSVCRDFETDSMSKDDIRKMSLIWYLNRQEFMEDVEAGRNLFQRANFICRYWKELSGRPEARYLLARIYLELEEYEEALRQVEVLKRQFPWHPLTRRILSSPPIVFKLVNRKAASMGDKVVYDCLGYLGDTLVPETKGQFQVAVLGSGDLVPGFEEALCGMRPLRWKEFFVEFPRDYFHPGLAGKRVRFQAYLYHVLKPVRLKGWEELAQSVPHNIYRIQDLPSLQKHNENLYYLVLKETLSSALSKDMTDYLNLIGLYLKLGLRKQAMDMLCLIPIEPTLVAHLARILRSSGMAEEALNVLERVGDLNEELSLLKALCLFDLHRWAEAEDVARGIFRPGDEEALKLKVRLASRLALPIDEYLRREEELLECQIGKETGRLITEQIPVSAPC